MRTIRMAPGTATAGFVLMLLLFGAAPAHATDGYGDATPQQQADMWWTQCSASGEIVLAYACPTGDWYAWGRGQFRGVTGANPPRPREGNPSGTELMWDVEYAATLPVYDDGVHRDTFDWVGIPKSNIWDNVHHFGCAIGIASANHIDPYTWKTDSTPCGVEKVATHIEGNAVAFDTLLHQPAVPNTCQPQPRCDSNGTPEYTDEEYTRIQCLGLTCTNKGAELLGANEDPANLTPICADCPTEILR